MTGRLSNIIQWASIVIGITGMSFDKLISVQPIVSYALIGIATAAFALLVFIQLLYREPNRFDGKQEVDMIWRRLLSGADRSIWVFAGDLSWASKSRDVLNQRRSSGVELRVLCRWPSSAALIGEIRTLFQSGVQVKFYEGDFIRVRGIVVDTESGPSSGTALTVSKLPKPDLKDGIFEWMRTQAQPGSHSLFDYKARRYIPGVDADYISMLDQLFDSAWGMLPEGLILTRLVIGPERLLSILSRVAQYRDLTAGQIEIRRVEVAKLNACCRTVRSSKLPLASSLTEAYRLFKLEMFETSLLEIQGRSTVLLPPIVERQPDGSLVVIDGMHRLHQLMTLTDRPEALCLVITGVGELPSTPVPLREVRISPKKIDREENFVEFKGQLFRDIKQIEIYLEEEASRQGSAIESAA